jgi:hypothetical protein
MSRREIIKKMKTQLVDILKQQMLDLPELRQQAQELGELVTHTKQEIFNIIHRHKDVEKVEEIEPLNKFEATLQQHRDLIDELVENEPEYKHILESLLKNTINYHVDQQTLGVTATGGMGGLPLSQLLLIVALFVDNLRPMLGISNFAAMGGPLGLLMEMKGENRGVNDVGMNQYRMEIVKSTIEASSRKFGAKFNVTAPADMQGFHPDVDIEREFALALAAEMAEEVTRETLSKLLEASNNDAPPIKLSSTSDLEMTGMLQIAKLSNEISKSTVRGMANVLITSPLLISFIRSIPTFNFEEADKSHNNGLYDLKFVGTCDMGGGTYKLYVTLSPMFESEKGVFTAVLGYAGETGIDRGLIYHPYIPIMPLSVSVDPASFVPQQQFMTRGHLAVRNTHFRSIKFDINPMFASPEDKDADEPETTVEDFVFSESFDGKGSLVTQLPTDEEVENTRKIQTSWTVDQDQDEAYINEMVDPAVELTTTTISAKPRKLEGPYTIEPASEVEVDVNEIASKLASILEENINESKEEV